MAMEFNNYEELSLLVIIILSLYTLRCVIDVQPHGQRHPFLADIITVIDIMISFCIGILYTQLLVALGIASVRRRIPPILT